MNQPNTEINLPADEISGENNKTTIKPVLPPESTGRIAITLGRGEDAKNSIVFITIICCFGVGILFSSLIVINVWCYPRNPDVNIANEIKNVWEFIIPLITLSLGYAFGKSRD